MATKQERELFWVAGVGLVLFLFGGFGLALMATKPPRSQNVDRPSESQVPEVTSSGSRNKPSYAGTVYSLPKIEVPRRSSANEAPWKERFSQDALVEAADLAKPEYAKRFRILDLCPRSQYETRHVPEAIWVDYYTWKEAFTNDRNQQVWEKRIGALGIDINTPVVVYDSGTGRESAYVRSMLLYWGVKDVRLLDGGWPTWLYQGAHHESLEPQVTPRPCKLSPNEAYLPGNDK